MLINGVNTSLDACVKLFPLTVYKIILHFSIKHFQENCQLPLSN